MRASKNLTKRVLALLLVLVMCLGLLGTTAFADTPEESEAPGEPSLEQLQKAIKVQVICPNSSITMFSLTPETYKIEGPNDQGQYSVTIYAQEYVNGTAINTIFKNYSASAKHAHNDVNDSQTVTVGYDGTDWWVVGKKNTQNVKFTLSADSCIIVEPEKPTAAPGDEDIKKAFTVRLNCGTDHHTPTLAAYEPVEGTYEILTDTFSAEAGTCNVTVNPERYITEESLSVSSNLPAKGFDAKTGYTHNIPEAQTVTVVYENGKWTLKGGSQVVFDVACERVGSTPPAAPTFADLKDLQVKIVCASGSHGTTPGWYDLAEDTVTIGSLNENGTCTVTIDPGFYITSERVPDSGLTWVDGFNKAKGYTHNIPAAMEVTLEYVNGKWQLPQNASFVEFTVTGCDKIPEPTPTAAPTYAELQAAFNVRIVCDADYHAVAYKAYGLTPGTYTDPEEVEDDPYRYTVTVSAEEYISGTPLNALGKNPADKNFDDDMGYKHTLTSETEGTKTVTVVYKDGKWQLESSNHATYVAFYVKCTRELTTPVPEPTFDDLKDVFQLQITCASGNHIQQTWLYTPTREAIEINNGENGYSVTVKSEGYLKSFDAKTGHIHAKCDAEKTVPLEYVDGKWQLEKNADRVMFSATSSCVKAVASVNGTPYADLQDAINAANGSKVILLAKIDDVSKNLSVNGTVELDLAGFTLDLGNHWMKVESGRHFTITDSKTGGMITANETAVFVENGDLTVSGGTISGGKFEDYGATVYVEGGGLTVSGGTITAAGDSAVYICSGSDATVTNGEIAASGTYATVCVERGDLVVKGGTITSARSNAVYATTNSEVEVAEKGLVTAEGPATVCVEDESQLTVSGGTIMAAQGNAVYACESEVIVSAGGIMAEGSSPAVYAAIGSKLTVSGGTITSAHSNAVYAYESETIVNDGEITSSERSALSVNASELTVKDGKVTSDAAGGSAVYVDNGSVAAISGGTFTDRANKAVIVDGGSNLTVSGGHFSDKGIPDTYIASGKTMVDDPEYDNMFTPGYIVTFDDGGESPIVQGVATGTVIAPAEPTREGYAFAGWSDGSGSYAAGATITVTKSLTLTAQWKCDGKHSYGDDGKCTKDGCGEIAAYTVTFIDGWGNELSSGTYEHGDEIVVPADPTREGYTFTGWDPEVGATATKTVTYTAQWTQNTYTVTFDANGGSAVAGQIVEHGKAASRPDDPTRSGYSFVGWYTSATGGTAYDFAATVTGDLTLYARWEYIFYDDGYYPGTGTTGGGSSSGGDLVDIGEEDVPLAGLPFTFEDVSEEDWFYEAVRYVFDAGLMNGTDKGFEPDNTTTRGQLMTILARMDGAETEGGSTWYEKGMEWAVENGVSDGSDPEKAITREQLATMLWRYLGEPEAGGEGLSRFPDASSVSDWAEAAMVWAVENGIITGSDGMLNPRSNATRAEMATMLMRFCEKFVSEEAEEAKKA